MKSIIFLSLLAAAIAIPLAEAQISLPQLILVNGTVFCSANASVPGATLTPFPNAGALLQCGGTGIANTTTGGTGTFSVKVNSANLDLLTSLLTGGCRVVVTTPLSACNGAIVPRSGLLTSPPLVVEAAGLPPLLSDIPSLLRSLPNTLNIIAPSFALSADTNV